jgi:hypothetical protein
MSRNWVENEATWTNAAKTTSWQQQGGDYVTTAIASVVRPRSQGNGWVKFNVLAAIKDFARDPASNYGLIIINTQGAQEIDFATCQNRTAALAPTLSITYEAIVAAAPAHPAQAAPSALVARVRGRELRLSRNSPLSSVNVTVISSAGRRCAEVQVPAAGSVALSNLAAGIYYVSFTSARGRVCSAVSVAP